MTTALFPVERKKETYRGVRLRFEDVANERNMKFFAGLQPKQRQIHKNVQS